jgi:integrase
MQDRPARANQAVTVLRVLLKEAVEREWLQTNPANKVKALKIGDGWQPWPDASLEKAHEGFTGAPRIAFMLALYTGQRKGDILKMRWNDIDDDGIKVKQGKTGTELWIPLHSTLRMELTKAKSKTKGLVIVARRNGQPYEETGFYKEWRKQQNKLGLAYLKFHGLRKNATKTLFEAGCTPQQVQAITGHASLQTLEHYGKAANQKVMAQDAMNAMETESGKLGGKPRNE